MKKQDIKERVYEDVVGNSSNKEMDHSPEQEQRFNQFFNRLPDHVRWRTIRKLNHFRISKSALKDEDSAYSLGNHRKKKIESCPICNRELTGSPYREYTPILGQSLVESVTKCPMGCYQNSWSYSLVEITVGGKKVLSYHPYNLSWAEEQQLLDSLQPLYAKERRKKEQIIRLYHRKKKSQAKKKR